MKLKAWISKSIVLAMVLALMVPMPVAAKSSKSGGKLVKSVTEYTYNTDKGNWSLNSRTSYTYDKKKNPKEIKETYFYNEFLGIPTDASSEILTAKYKYKGKTPKSMKLVNEAGRVKASYAYKGGKAVSGSFEYNASTDENNKVHMSTGTFSASFAKNGLATGFYGTDVEQNDNQATSYVRNMTFTNTQKKGIPSLIISNVAYADSDDPLATSGAAYSKFDKKGLGIECGNVDLKTGAPKAEYVAQYTVKKGVVKQAVVYHIGENGAPTPVKMYKFSYTKTKISKSRYLSMINDIVDCHYSHFSWY